ncbi:MAG: carbonic anhydrase family protein [Deltaproteobacteria bacterium]|nr:carbonic anhydrase family protein [Deltaproteobacteria bacterium]
MLLVFSAGIIEAGEGKKEHAGHWGYEGEAGPNRWGELSPEFAVCSEGRTQSPIDITTGTEKDLKDLEFKYNKNSSLDIVNNGHTVMVNYEGGSALVVDGDEYGLVQFHFHSPSEHTVNGNYYDMEMHLVHKNKEGKLAVVGVFMKKGGQNTALDGIWANLPKEEGKKTAGVPFNAADLLPQNKAYFRYPGSLTTPPCSEGVTWLVLKNTVEVSAEQIEAFRKIMDNNNRPVQPLNEREVETKD